MATPGQILARRETRQAEQVRLLGLNALPVVSFTLVAPGPIKDDAACQAAFAAGLDAVTALLRGRGWAAVESVRVDEVTGPEWLAAVDAPARELKEALVALEDAEPLGRLWDLDVLAGLDGGLPVILGRRGLALPPRRCLVCERDAAGCARSRRHALPVVLAVRDALVALGTRVRSSACSMHETRPKSAAHPTGHARGCTPPPDHPRHDLRDPGDDALDAARGPGEGLRLAELAVRALVVEARLTPKPGLVDAANSGAHPDMDLPLLERSAHALHDWLAACWWAGVATASDPAEATTARLVGLGVAGEAAMLAATGGVNTHKGALFALGLALGAHGRLCGAPGDSDAHGDVAGSAGPPPAEAAPPVHPGSGAAPVDAIGAEVARLASGLLDGWLAHVERDDTHGARAYRELGVTGARGEAASGFATVRTVGLPAYRGRLGQTGDEADALRWALVALIAAHPDTNLYARGGAGGLADARAWASGLLDRRPDPDALVAELDAADRWFTARRLSPGGSADLLALTWWFAHQQER